MKRIALVLTCVLFSQVSVAAAPTGPDESMTPGSLCSNPTELRYPEKIKYCKRNVDTKVKNRIIADYMKKYNFSVTPNNRDQYKIDHYIPLCMGGSNEVSNLWPQHKTVFDVTDPLEPLLCEKMADGELKQAKAIQIVKYAKNHLDEVPKIVKDLNDGKTPKIAADTEDDEYALAM